MKQGKTSFFKETQQKPVHQQIIDDCGGEKRFCELVEIDKKQVDFKLLNAYVKAMGKLYDTPDIKNFVDFFELLAKSSTFAHKAHKELKQLNM